jgi:hypothetical protein
MPTEFEYKKVNSDLKRKNQFFLGRSLELKLLTGFKTGFYAHGITKSLSEFGLNSTYSRF